MQLEPVKKIGETATPLYAALAGPVAKDWIAPTPRAHGAAAQSNASVRKQHDSPRRKQSFIDQYVFPDGELAAMSEVLCAAEAARFEIRDIETLREHYALTLRRWVRNLQDHASEVLYTTSVSERTVRTWLLYMAGSVAAFERGDISVCQILLRSRDHARSAKICTRAKWYADGPSTADRLAA